MMLRRSLLALLVLFGVSAHAAGTSSRQIDSVHNSTGGSSLAVPSGGADLVSAGALPSTGQVLVGNSSSYYAAATPTQEVVSGQCNGSLTAITLGNTPSSSALVTVYLDSALLRQGTGLDYTISGATITLASACATGQKVYAVYIH